jgi:hypothetical protein
MVMDDLILKLKMLWIYRGSFREWYHDVWKKVAGARMCCDGYMCGCYGSDNASWWEYLWTDRKRKRAAAKADRAGIVAWLRKENGLCDCFARSSGECGCGAWDDYKTEPLLDIADAIESGADRKDG